MAKMRPDPKKGFPGGFFLFLLAAILIIIGVQTFTSSAAGKVSFSHQAEHLTNLNLTIPEENRKIAQNDNLVTFTGRFRDRLPEESVERYRYLELLNRNHELKSGLNRLSEELDVLQEHVKEAADLYLHLSGQTLPRSGYTVVSPLYDTPGRDGAVVINNLTDRDVVSLPFVQRSLSLAQQAQSIEAVDALGKDLRDFVSHLRSAALGIGNEASKNELKALASQLAASSGNSLELQLRTYRNALNQLTSLIGNLGLENQGVRLSSLRSVRNYAEELEQYASLSQELEKNESLLEKSRAKLASAIWFFNNQELSTRALEKQDPEVFGHWFAQAKDEWSGFDENKGLAYRAPDQPRNVVLEKTFKSEEPSPNYFSYLLTVLPVMLVILFLYFIFSRQMKGAGSSAMNCARRLHRLRSEKEREGYFAR